MTRILLFMALCALLCGCGKKSRSNSTEPNPLLTALQGSKEGPHDGSNDGNHVSGTKGPIFVRPTLPTGWIEFHHPDGAYSVFLPSYPRPTKVSAGSNLRQQVPVGRALMSNHATTTASPLYIELGASIYSPELADGVRAAHERSPVSGLNGKRTSITWAGYPAFEETSESEGNHMLHVKRWMRISNRGYYCSLYGQQAGHPTDEERAVIFDSFVVGK